MWELNEVVFIEDARERPVLLDSAEILEWSVEKRRRKCPRARVGEWNASSSDDIKFRLITNNFALISRS